MKQFFCIVRKYFVYLLILLVCFNAKNYSQAKDSNANYNSKNSLKTNTLNIKANSSGTWKKTDGKWWYEYSSGGYAVGWEYIDGKWYHFDSSGWMETGWIKLDDKWYYLNDSGAMEIDWIKVDNKWYYLNKSGVMQTGWQHIALDDYYFYSDGAFEKTNRRALILGETSTPQVPIFDVTSTAEMMRSLSFDNKHYSNLKVNPIISYPDKTKSDIINKIETTFKNSKYSDINYIYITCHGGKDGKIFIDSKHEGISGSEFRTILDKYNGRFVLLIDCCYSGNIVDKSVGDFRNEFLDSFLIDSEKSGELKTYRYSVICSSSKNETSSGGNLSLATKYWLLGGGYDAINESQVSLKADSNNDSRVSIKELYDYSRNEVLSRNSNQHVVYYSLYDDFVVFSK